ncbi:MAG: citrate/2-methylcitrate synthase [Spirochaetota bacterium]
MIQKAELVLDGTSYELPVITGADQRQGINISRLAEKAGVVTYDPGFFNTGMVTSSVSNRDPVQNTLSIRGYDIRDLVYKTTFVETAYLLIYGDLPSKDELDDFSRRLTNHALIHEDMINLFDGFPANAHPLAVLSTMVMSLSSYYPSDYEESIDKGVDQIALLLSKIRTIAAFSYKKMIGQPFTYPQSKLSFCTNFLYMLFSLPTYEYEVPQGYDQILNQLWILYSEHEQNAAATTVQLVGSTQANLFASISSGISALWGSREGGQNVAAVELIEDIIEFGGDPVKYFNRIKKGEIQLHSNGFGHTAYTGKSPRSIIARELFLDFYKDKKMDQIAELAMQINEIVSTDSYFLERNIYPNLEFYSGVIFHSLGIPKTMFTAMQVIGKLTGWMAHWRELRKKGEYKKVRPRQIYEGYMNRTIS